MIKQRAAAVTATVSPKVKRYFFTFMRKVSPLSCDTAWNKRFLGIERDFDCGDRWIAVWRSSVVSDFHYGPGLLMLPDDVRLPIAVGDDKSDMSSCRQHIKGPEAQRRLLNPAVLIVG